MNNKNKKLASRIICGIMVPFLLLLNTGLAEVAYAADPTPAPVVGPDCTTGFPDGTKFASPDNQNCKKMDPPGYDAAKDTCGTSFHVNKQLSTANSSGKTDGELWCSPSAGSGMTPESAKAISNGIAILSGVQQMLNRLIWPVLVLTGGLMGNDLLYGNGMEEKLRDIWIPIRNLVNILFVIVLVGLALYNVLGLSDDNTSIKSLLPKIVVGIIAVNFSFLAIKVVLDGINVMTTAIFALPDQVSAGTGDALNPDLKVQERLCAALESTPFSQFDEQADELIVQQKQLANYRTVGQRYNNDITTANGTIIKGDESVDQIKQKISVLDTAKQDQFKKDITAAESGELCTGKKLNDQGTLFLRHYNSRNAAFAMALNMGNIVFYNDVDTKSLSGSASDSSFEKLFTNTLFSMILYIIYCVSFIALFIVLLGRVVVMWLSIAVSPILLLMIASPTVKEKMGGLSKLSEQFTKNAIAPLLISLSMTVGWIMLKAVQGLNLGSQTTFSINPSNGVPVASLNTLQDFMVALGVIAVVWMGVFSAAEGTIAQGATDWIKDKVQTAGKFVGSLPFKHMPILPIALPDHPHDHYTFSQLGHYIETLGRGDDSKLEEFAKGKKSANADNLLDMHKPAELASWLHNAKEGDQDLTDPKYRQRMRQWLERNPGVASDMENKGTLDQKDLIRDFKILANSPDTEEGKKAAAGAAEKIYKNKAVLNAPKDLPISATPVKTPAPAGKPEAKKAEPGLAKESATGKKLVGKKTDGTAEDEETTNARFKEVNDRKVIIDGEIAKPKIDAKAKETITNQVKEIGNSFTKTGQKADMTDLKAILGANYDKVVKTLGGPVEASKVLNPPPAIPGDQGTAPTPPPAATP